MAYRFNLITLVSLGTAVLSGHLEASVADFFGESSQKQQASSSRQAPVGLIAEIRSTVSEKLGEGERKSSSPIIGRWTPFPKTHTKYLYDALHTLAENNMNSITWYLSSGPAKLLLTHSELPVELVGGGVNLELMNGMSSHSGRVINFRVAIPDQSEIVYQVQLKHLGLSEVDLGRLHDFHPLSAETFISPTSDKMYQVMSIKGLKNIYDLTSTDDINWDEIDANEVSIARVCDDGQDFHVVYGYIDPNFKVKEHGKDALYDPTSGAFKYFLVTLARKAIL